MEIRVESSFFGERIDKYLSEYLSDYSRSRINTLINDGNILINNNKIKPSYKLCPNDLILFNEPDIVPLEYKAKDIPIEILYEDDDIIVVNKPKNMVVHPANGHMDDTLVNALLFSHGDTLSGINGVQRPGIVHRIDMDTTGSLIVCKNDQAHNHIANQIKNHTVNRIYVGIVHGNLKEDGTVNAPIGRSEKDRKKMAVNQKNGKEAITHYHVLESLKGYTYTEFKLETGRTHQIRVHMASIGHPLLGDELYGPKKCPYKLSGQTLHAKTIGFIHPRTEEYMEINAPIPEYMNKLLNNLK